MQSNITCDTKQTLTLNIQFTGEDNIETWSGLHDGCLQIQKMCRNTQPGEIRPVTMDMENLATEILVVLNKHFS